jgi:aspartate racemase
MDLPVTDPEVWATLEATARAIAPQCAFYAIACNTLNVYDERLAALGLSAEFVSFGSAVRGWARREHVERLGLLGARPVASLSEWSPYRSLADQVDVEPPSDLDALHALITEVKTNGGGERGLGDRLTAIVRGFESETLLLACTELPLIALPVKGHRLVDVTDLVAQELVRRWSLMASE